MMIWVEVCVFVVDVIGADLVLTSSRVPDLSNGANL